MKPTLASRVRGKGADLVLIHGWGLSSRVWDPVIERLSARFRVQLIDLPGHGANRGVRMPTGLAEIGGMLRHAATPGAVWVGWSLGGLVALQAALDDPCAVPGLVLCATTPRFLAAEDWKDGMSKTVMSQFAEELTADYRQTVTRFLTLQAQGDDSARVVLRRLRAVVFSDGDPDPDGLRSGLELLCQSDLRVRLPQLDIPVLVIGGARDRLVPPAATRFLAAALRRGRLSMIASAGHAPFLSHPQEFCDLLEGFHGDRADFRSPGP